MVVDEDLAVIAAEVLEAFRSAGLKVATAESCTGGLIAALLTSRPGSSDVFERGFVTYSNAAKCEILDVPQPLIEELGAVSAPVAAEMARGALVKSEADAAVAVTGVAGPGGGSAEKPVGLVFVAVAIRDEDGEYVEEFRFEDLGRDHIRNETARNAMEMLIAYGIPDDGN
jgi:nicotinamide-nucleotide amidase